MSCQLTSAGALTPPTTPVSAEGRRTSASADIIEVVGLKEIDRGVEDLNMEARPLRQAWEETVPRVYPGSYKLLGPEHVYGRGVWSAVYQAHASGNLHASEDHSMPDLGLPTPPTSPSNKHKPRLLAIKAPTRRDANKILGNEARVLTYLHRTPTRSDYIINFHGFDSARHSLVLDAVPRTLDNYLKAAATNARANFSTQTMFDPVIGRAQWAHLAERLINGLAFLHDVKNVVHGDIKPANILLRSDPCTTDGADLFQPLYCDFSSSRVVMDTTLPIEEVSAVTTDFTSPELLSSFHRRNNTGAVVTFASDVFALGVTLLVAAIGESPYAGARMEIMKVGMAKEGRPLQFARGGEQASRLMKGGVVERMLIGAVEKDPEKRVKAADWKAQLGTCIEDWKEVESSKI
ncbi:protein kinase domain-containing protein [Lasallia pustulata]|uniref:Protein kinase domain-containing protein n=1 Tax=Lasallia pustulata TaxID=136370 RepID=A0A1W5CRS4_9LECA|nr:protein kinase domain-containing protein [Lasallia pustulata]